jgi:hypothetical protein
MKTNITADGRRGLEGLQSTLEQLRDAVEQIRALVAARLAAVDVDDLKDRGAKLAAAAQEQGTAYADTAINQGRRAAAMARKHGPRYADRAMKRGQRYARLARKHGPRYAKAVRKNIERRVRPKPSRLPLALGLLGASIAVGIGVGVLLYDKSRRQALTSGVGRLQAGARQRYADLGGVGGAVGLVRDRVRGGSDERPALEAQARQAITQGGPAPADLRVSVEGRTVYLRGTVDDAAYVEAAVERVQGIDGVVAVVDMTTPPVRPGSSNGNS